MSIPLIPWEGSVFPDEIQSELNRRKTNRNFTFIDSEKGGWDNESGDWKTYRGPMTPWIRFCSNGAGKSAAKSTEMPIGGIPEADYYDKQGFVLFGGKDFYSGYGFNKNPGDELSLSTIGYMPDGTPHTIDNDIRTSNYPIHVPPPEIERISVTIQKELYRRATIDWVCFSPKQLEYMTPYFLVPNITCILEWGWNHFDPTSLLNLNNLVELKQLNNNPYPLYTEHILKSRGNYDILFGKITHFEWSIEGTRIRCKTEITSQDRIYAGLSVDSSMINTNDKGVDSNSKTPNPVEIFGSLRDFISKEIKNIKFVDNPDISSPKPTPIGNFIKYLKVERYKTENETAQTEKIRNLVFGVYYGKDAEAPTAMSVPTLSLTEIGGIRYPTAKGEVAKKEFRNVTDDFDGRGSDQLWINMGLLIEILNYHSFRITGFNKEPMFKVDIDDCVIAGHPNLISTDGGVMLIPNAEAPKYFYGAFGNDKVPLTEQTKKTAVKPRGFFNRIENIGVTNPADREYVSEYNKMAVSDINISFDGFGTSIRDIAEANDQLSDYKLWRVCLQPSAKAKRDDINVVINRKRFDKGLKTGHEFPFLNRQSSGFPDSYYPARYAGYLKNIYFNVDALVKILSDTSVKTFTHVIDKVLSGISDAAGNFWDFRLVSSTGKSGMKKTQSATMKIVDYRFVSSVNSGKVFSFDYFDSDSLLQNIKFTPTLSNAQAIRTIYAETNNPTRGVVLSDNNELLNYHFRDRLFLDEEDSPSKIKTTDSFKSLMESLQGLKPAILGGVSSLQVTDKHNDGEIIKRLVLPSPEVLKLLLDDGDTENNPKYTGIMPGIQAQFTIQGIGGLRTFMMFLVRNLPEPYSHENIIFRIIDLNESLESGKWITSITAGIIPLRNHIRRRIGLPPK